MQEPLVSVIILNWNGIKVIGSCLNSVKQQTYKNLEVIVVDNASNDGSSGFIKKNFPEVKLIENKSNLGFGAGNNVGIARSRGEYIMILNNDTRLAPDCIEELKNSIEKDRSYGASASMILLNEDKDLIDAAGTSVCLDGMSIGRGRLEHKDRFQHEEEVFFSSGCASLYRRKMLDDIEIQGDFYDGDFFAYAEDTDLGWRARSAGWRCIYNPKAIVYHSHSASTSTYSSLKAFLVERNRIWVIIKNFPLSVIIMGFLFTFRRYIFQAYGALTYKGAAGRFTKEINKSELVKILLKANIAAMKGLQKMIRKRKLIFKKKSISNREMIVLFNRFGMSAREIAFKE